MPEANDMTLVREYARRNSEPAFETLVRRHVGLVYSVALRQCGNPAQAEEITQAVFLILARKAPRLRPDTILAGWLHETARFATASFLRGERRRQHREQEAFMLSKLQPSAPDPDWERLAPMLDEAIGQLGRADRNAVLLRFFENKSAREIAAVLQVQESAAQKRLNRAVEKLRAHFLKRGVAVSAGALSSALPAQAVPAVPAHLAAAVLAVAAKGTVVSSSTLTLIQGALKIMIWTKAKTAAVAAAAVILTLGTTLVTIKTIQAAHRANGPDLQGAWEGVMQLDAAGVAPGKTASTRVVLKLAKTRTGYRATTDWIDQGRKDVPMGRVVYDFPSLQLEWTPRNTWKLTVDAEAAQMTLDHSIHFIQPAPVLLKRTTTPDPVPERLDESDFARHHGSDLQGYWKGVLSLPKGAHPDTLPVDLKINESANGTYLAELDSPMQGANGQPLSVIYNRPAVTLTVNTGAGLFQGEINNAGTELTGTWTQEGAAMAAVFRQADYQAEHAHDDDQNYAFTSENDLQGHWTGSWEVTIEKSKATVREALDIARLPDGSYSAALANVDEFGQDDPVPTSDFQYSPPLLRLGLKWTGVRFEGKLENGKLAGTWFQSGGGFPLVFERNRAR